MATFPASTGACRVADRTPRVLRVPETLGALLLLASAATAPAQREPPRYLWQPGGEWIYSHETSTGGNPGDALVKRRIEVHCLAWDGQTAVVLLVMRASDAREPACVGVVRLDAAGQRTWPAEMLPARAMLGPALDVLPVLPGAAQNPGAWTVPSDELGRLYRCRSRRPEAETSAALAIETSGEELTDLAPVSTWTHQGRYWFDETAGLLLRCEVREQDTRARRDEQRAAVLQQHVTHTPAWADRRIAEIERFLQRLRHAARLEDSLLENPAALETILAQLEQLWSAFDSDLETKGDSPLAHVSALPRQAVRGRAQQLRFRAALAARWLNGPAGPWTLQDLKGRTVTSESVRSGPTLECFWSAVVPASVQLAADLENLAIPPNATLPRIICYNMDQDAFMAARFAQVFALPGVHIQGGPLRVVEEMPELPVVRYVDGGGVVRALWVGPAIRLEDIADKIFRRGR